MTTLRLTEVYKEKPSLEPLINKIKADEPWLKNQVNFIWLIGSYAKGTAREDSDVDLLVVQHEDNLEPWKRELRHFAQMFPGIKLQTHQLLNEQWERIKQKKSCFYQGVVNEEDHIEVIGNDQ
ncbi:hypothetical protein CMI37_13445 [Candidatus Pacearchaeota archaeon]|nr:hypothetical protein [Candidatus Pacearchaeota archaeon]|tara:strand:- start:64 stop:432 length:369 start_codon:yes stop_codon:yes gene_type:complete